jgi:hypothetical protein
MKLCIHVRPRDDKQGWAVDVFDGRRAWSKTHLGEQPLNKAEAHRLAHKLRDPKFYTARTKRAVNSGARDGMAEARVGTMPGSGIPLPHPPGTPGVRDPDHPCDMFSPGKPTNGGCQGDGHYLCGKCALLEMREPLTDSTGCDV